MPTPMQNKNKQKADAIIRKLPHFNDGTRCTLAVAREVMLAGHQTEVGGKNRSFAVAPKVKHLGVGVYHVWYESENPGIAKYEK